MNLQKITGLAIIYLFTYLLTYLLIGVVSFYVPEFFQS